MSIKKFFVDNDSRPASVAELLRHTRAARPPGGHMRPNPDSQEFGEGALRASVMPLFNH